MRYNCFILSLVLLFSERLHAQINDSSKLGKVGKNIIFYEYCFDSAASKRLYIFVVDNGSHTGYANWKNISQKSEMIFESKNSKTPLLTIHGNVLYDVNYYSHIDTPYNQSNIYHHTVQAYLDITVKAHYPFRIYFSTNFSNTGLFKNFTDVNLLYKNTHFNQGLKTKLLHKLQENEKIIGDVDSVKNQLDRKIALLHVLQKDQSYLGKLQQLVKSRENAAIKKYQDSIESISTAFVDSTTHGLDKKQPNLGNGNSLSSKLKTTIQEKMKLDSTKQSKVDSTLKDYKKYSNQYDSLVAEINRLQQKYSKLKDLQVKDSLATGKQIDAIRNSQDLTKMMQRLHMNDSSLPKGYKTLMDLRTVGIGTNIINYSELSVKNLHVNGVQVEYNPGWYLAFAAGTVDYRFRDYIVQNRSQTKQYVGVVRLGTGMKDGTNIIFTYYTGRRQLYNYFTDTIVQTSRTVSPHLMGFTLEANYRLNRNNVVSAEIAKSSMPYYTLNKPNNFLSGTLHFKDHSNEAYSIKLVSFLPSTKTSFVGYYKKLGINFQSFSLFTNGSAQHAWNVKINQPFFKRKLEVVASLNSNDFNNPYISQGYKSATVFKSIQATFRKNKWPVVTAGYAPSTQLIKLNDDQFIQNLFYTFTGSISHYYALKKNRASTSIFFTQFYNHSADSNFVYFNTKNLLINQTLFLSGMSMNFNLSEAANNYYQLFVADGSVQVRCSKWLSLGGGLKYNKQTVYQMHQLGFSANAAIKIPMLGEFRLMVDKGFVPGPNRHLVPNNIGRFTYFKIF